MLINLVWSQNEEDDGTHDLTGKAIKYINVDVIRDMKHRWSILLDNVRVKSNISTREEAISFVENI